MVTRLSSPHAIWSGPPSSSIVAPRPASPRRCAATSAAQAPVPQAMVRPAPRSHTLRRIRSSPRSSATPILARSGNSGSCSRDGPSAARSTESASSTKKTACGLPMLTAAGSASGPRESGRCSVSTAEASGMSRQPKRGSPMSTVTATGPARRAASVPAAVSSKAASRPDSSIAIHATQRAALPQASASPPSALWMVNAASAAPSAGSRRTISWSQPMPVRRCAIARTRSAPSAISRRLASRITKSLPSPCILVNADRSMAGVISCQRRGSPETRRFPRPGGRDRLGLAVFGNRHG